MNKIKNKKLKTCISEARHTCQLLNKAIPQCRARQAPPVIPALNTEDRSNKHEACLGCTGSPGRPEHLSRSHLKIIIPIIRKEETSKSVPLGNIWPWDQSLLNASCLTGLIITGFYLMASWSQMTPTAALSGTPDPVSTGWGRGSVLTLTH